MSYGELRVEGVFGEEAEALARLRATCATRALLGGGLRDGRHHQRLDARLGVEDLLLAEAAIDDEHDAVDGHRRLRDVRAHHDLATPRRRGLEGVGLLLRGQGGVQRHDDQLLLLWREGARLPTQGAAGVVDLLLAREEHQNVARTLVQVDLNRRFHGGRHVVALRLCRVEHLHGEESARNAKQGRVVEIALLVKEGKRGNLEGGDVECGAHHDELQVLSVVEDLLDHSENHVGGQSALVHFVENDDIVLLEQRVGDCLSQKHAIGDVLQHRLGARVLLKTHRVAHLGAALHVHFLSDATRHTRCSDTTRLRAGNVGNVIERGIQQMKEQRLHARREEQRTCGICVVFPLPVSPSTMRTEFLV